MSVMYHVQEALRYYRTIPFVFLGFGFDRAWIACIFYYEAYSTLAMSDYYLFMAALGIVSLVCALLAARLNPLGSSSSAQVFSLGAMVAGSALLFLGCQVAPSVILKVIGLVLGGAGSGVLYLMWADFYGRMTPLSVITYFSLGVLFGEVFKLLFIWMPAGYIQFFAVALPFLSVGCMRASFRKLEEGQRFATFAPLSLRSYPWKPMMLVTLIFFVASYFGGQMTRQNIGHCVGVVTVVILMLVVVSPRARLFKVNSFNQILLPLLVISFALFLPINTPFVEIAGFRLEAAYTMAFMLILIVLSSVSYRYGVNPVWLSGIQRAMRSVVEIIGWVLSCAVFAQHSEAVTSLVVFGIELLVLTVFVIAFFTEKGLSAEWGYRFADLTKEKLPAARLKARVSEVALVHGLSTRETDVLRLLAAERSLNDIADELFMR